MAIQAGVGGPGSEPFTADDAVLERLRSLGYIE
jgi:hypothetical protein